MPSRKHKSGAIIDKDAEAQNTISREQRRCCLWRVDRLEEARVRRILELEGDGPVDRCADRADAHRHRPPRGLDGSAMTDRLIGMVT